MSEALMRTPKPAPDRRDAKSFPLTPTDGYVLSRIDGTLNEADLTASTGLPEAQVQASLAKLEQFGLIVFDRIPPPPSPSIARMAAALRTSSVQIRAATVVTITPVPPAAPAAPAAHAAHAAPAAPPTPPPSARALPPDPPRVAVPPAAPPSAPQADPDLASLAEEIDLDLDLKKRVLAVHRDLERSDYYALLGVDKGVDRKGVKRAYYELAAAFHPDRYFRKRLGTFKVRMEAVFARLTLAHDTLSDRERRVEYDAYLTEQRTAQTIEEDLARGLRELKQAEETAERAARSEVAISAPPPPLDATLTPQVDVGARRDALARRLLGGNPSRSSAPPRAPTPPPMQASTMPTGDAMNALRQRYLERVAKARASESSKFAKQAETALASGDLVASANAFRVAANLTPDNGELEKKARDALVRADLLLSETYIRQARYEENHQQWIEAARSWGRVCKVSPKNAQAHERAADTLVKSNGDLHDATRLAQRACELDPENALFRVTLATCYQGAGLTLNARRELDTATRLAPHDDKIQAMIKRVGQPA